MDPHAGHDMTAEPTADPHAGHDMGAMDHGNGHAMTGALGTYPGGRESSGTSWQPDSAEHRGLMTMSGDWMLMAHADLFGVYSKQGSRRGDDKLFGAGMIMGMARRPVGGGTLQLRAGFSPDPLMGKSGYPLLLASGETANGRDRLIDRQHPHDFVMELSASISQPIGPKSSVFLYGGLPGEPAFGPGAFMHRESIMDSPEAPISHHWLDSQHISFGVLTGGVVLDRFKVEVSRFNGREPDQYRWNIETGPLDSTAVRVSFNPTRDLSLQASWASLKDPEQLEPGVNQKRWSASAIYATDLSNGWRSASTLAWGRKSAEGHDPMTPSSPRRRSRRTCGRCSGAARSPRTASCCRSTMRTRSITARRSGSASCRPARSAISSSDRSSSWASAGCFRSTSCRRGCAPNMARRGRSAGWRSCG